MKKHLYSLDYLRAIASILVCLLHFVERPHLLAETNIFKIIFSNGHYGVQMFFIISGFVITLSMDKGNYTLKKWTTFLKKRLIRIDPPYFICIGLILLLNYLTTIAPGYKGPGYIFDVKQILYHIGYLNAFMGKDWLNPVFWTLALEFQFYLVISLCFSLFCSSRIYIWVPTLIAFNILHLYSSSSIIFYHAPYFSLGILACRYYLTRRNEFLLAIAITLMGTYGLFSYKEVLVSFITLIVIFVPLPETGFSQFFGNISYSLYLLHFPIGVRCLHIVQRFSLNDYWNLLLLLFSFILVVAASYLYYLYVERPFKNYSQNISYSKTKSNTIKLVN